MLLSAYLCTSRHGVYYFRWPLPNTQDGKRNSLRLSLKTKCPDHAGDIARYLASCGKLLKESKALAHMRQDHIRAKVKAYFEYQYERYVELMNSKGVSEHALTLLEPEIDVHDEGVKGHSDLSDMYLDGTTVDHFRKFSGLSEADWSENEPGFPIRPSIP